MFSRCTRGRSSQRETADLQVLEPGSDFAEREQHTELSNALCAYGFGFPVLNLGKTEICGRSVHRHEKVLKWAKRCVTRTRVALPWKQ